MARPALIGVPSDRRQIGPHPFQAVGEKYVRAIVDAQVGVPLLIPSLDPPLDLDALLPQFDGILLTGSPSNIEPHHYSDEPSWEGNLHDPHRDATTLSLVHVAVRHRNHLPVMLSSSTPIAYGSGVPVVDFTLTATQVSDADARKNVGGTQVLAAGDPTFNQSIKYTGSGNDRDPILVNVGSTTPNNVRVQQLP